MLGYTLPLDIMVSIMPNESQALQLDIEVLRQFRAIFKSVRRHFQSIEQTCGISGSQLWALAKIAEEPDLTVTQLANSLAIHQSTASNLIEKLAEKGLVDRIKGQPDQRKTILRLTGNGQQAINSAPGPVQGLLPDALGRMPYNQLRDLYRMLAELIKTMEMIEVEDGSTPIADL